jgi:hypothetical protein
VCGDISVDLKLYSKELKTNFVGVSEGVGLGRIVGVSVGVGGINAVLEMTGVAECKGVFVIGTTS